MPYVPSGLRLRDAQSRSISHCKFLSGICQFVNCIYDCCVLCLGRCYRYCRFSSDFIFAVNFSGQGRHGRVFIFKMVAQKSFY
jgi:hypothetical protein